MVQFGGEIVNTRPGGSHTSTQMGSGHFAGEGFGKASYFRNLQVVDWDNTLLPVSNLKILADHPNCYDIRGGTNRVWGNYFYYGGPGKNPRCPWRIRKRTLLLFFTCSGLMIFEIRKEFTSIFAARCVCKYHVDEFITTRALCFCFFTDGKYKVGQCYIFCLFYF